MVIKRFTNSFYGSNPMFFNPVFTQMLLLFFLWSCLSLPGLLLVPLKNVTFILR